jgi:hypothetical protein
VSFPGNTFVDFESGRIPSGWSTYGDAPWSVIYNLDRTDEEHCYTQAAKAGRISHNQHSYLDVVRTVPTGSLYYNSLVSSEKNYDGLVLWIDLNNDGTWDRREPATGVVSGVPDSRPSVSYPAAYPESISVGASSDFDCRSNYTQFYPQDSTSNIPILDFLAPSSGGLFNFGITTTDRTGLDGDDPSGYVLGGLFSQGFSGTSSATPLASGIAGLILSNRPALTQSQVRQIMRDSARKVGVERYDVLSGRNLGYGSGRIDAYKALLYAQGTPQYEFVDVPQSSVFRDNIKAIYYQRITQGCGIKDTFCIDDPVTQEQIAAFVVRSIERNRTSTYCDSGSPFTDVSPTGIQCGNIKRFAELHLTTAVGTFRPLSLVTRGEMAAYIIRSLYGENFSYTPTPYFTDVPATNPYFKYVQKMKDVGLTKTTGTYYVERNLTRGEMAAFLSRAYLGMP